MQKLKTLLKGVEDSRMLNVMPLQTDCLAIEVVQPNFQTYLIFADKVTGDFRGAYHYQREIKSGFIYMCDEEDESDDSDSDLSQLTGDED